MTKTFERAFYDILHKALLFMIHSVWKMIHRSVLINNKIIEWQNIIPQESVKSAQVIVGIGIRKSSWNKKEITVRSLLTCFCGGKIGVKQKSDFSCYTLSFMRLHWFSSVYLTFERVISLFVLMDTCLKCLWHIFT